MKNNSISEIGGFTYIDYYSSLLNFVSPEMRKEIKKGIEEKTIKKDPNSEPLEENKKRAIENIMEQLSNLKGQLEETLKRLEFK